MKKHFLLVFCLLVLSLPLLGEDGEDDYWIDGSRKLSLEQEVGLAADFSNDQYELRNRDGLGEIYQEYPAVTIYKLEAGSLAETREFFANADVSLSPVFAERGGGLKALPGGVIVVFSAESDETEARELFRREGIEEQANKAVWHKRGYVVAAPPGLPSLRLANRLANYDIIAISSPDWWTNIYSNR